MLVKNLVNEHYTFKIMEINWSLFRRERPQGREVLNNAVVIGDIPTILTVK